MCSKYYQLCCEFFPAYGGVFCWTEIKQELLDCQKFV